MLYLFCCLVPLSSLFFFRLTPPTRWCPRPLLVGCYRLSMHLQYFLKFRMFYNSLDGASGILLVSWWCCCTGYVQKQFAEAGIEPRSSELMFRVVITKPTRPPLRHWIRNSWSCKMLSNFLAHSPPLSLTTAWEEHIYSLSHPVFSCLLSINTSLLYCYCFYCYDRVSASGRSRYSRERIFPRTPGRAPEALHHTSPNVPVPVAATLETCGGVPLME